MVLSSAPEAEPELMQVSAKLSEAIGRTAQLENSADVFRDQWRRAVSENEVLLVEVSQLKETLHRRELELESLQLAKVDVADVQGALEHTSRRLEVVTKAREATEQGVQGRSLSAACFVR